MQTSLLRTMLLLETTVETSELETMLFGGYPAGYLADGYQF